MTVGIVGAGITGLSLVHHLADRDREVVAFEAAPEPGGVIRSTRVEGHLLERGPQRIRLTDPVSELVDDVGISGEVIEADDDLPLYVYHRGRLRRVPRSLGEFVRTDLLSWSGKARVLYEPLTDPGRPDERAGGLLARKFGSEAYRNVIEPLFGGIYASDPAEMPAKHALKGLLALEEREGTLLVPALRRAWKGGSGAPPISFEDGLQRLPEALYRPHSNLVRLETHVETVGKMGDGYRIETGDDAVAVEDVVVTTPAGAAADVLRSVAPDAAARLDRLNYNPIAMVYLHSDVEREGFGYQVHGDESLRTRGVTWNASLFGREGVYTAFLGGMSDPRVLEETDETLMETASREFETVMGTRAEPLAVNRLRAYPAYDTSWEALEGLELPGGIHLATNYTARIGVPSRVREARGLAEQLAGSDPGR